MSALGTLLSAPACSCGLLSVSSIVPLLSSYILCTIEVTTPKRLTLLGGLIYIGVVNPNCATSISLSVPTGIVLELNPILAKFTTLKLVQST